MLLPLQKVEFIREYLSCHALMALRPPAVQPLDEGLWNTSWKFFPAADFRMSPSVRRSIVLLTGEALERWKTSKQLRTRQLA
jgi:hypothetical protein